VSLTKTEKRTRAEKEGLIDEVRSGAARAVSVPIPRP
jgi:hypothetical protein